VFVKYNVCYATSFQMMIVLFFRHCVRVLGGDVEKFRRAYDLLDQTSNDMELEVGSCFKTQTYLCLNITLFG